MASEVALRLVQAVRGQTICHRRRSNRRFAGPTMRTVTASKARQGLAENIEAARKEPVIIQRQRRNVAVVMSMDKDERRVPLNVAEFQRFCDQVGAKAKHAGMPKDTLAELSDVLSRRKSDRFVSRENRQRLLQLLGGTARVVTITQRILACRNTIHAN